VLAVRDSVRATVKWIVRVVDYGATGKLRQPRWNPVELCQPKSRKVRQRVSAAFCRA
jgi:hypothetical protein